MQKVAQKVADLNDHVPFNRPYLTGREAAYIAEALHSRRLSDNGPFTQRCQDWLRDRLGTAHVVLTHTCTAALEIAAILAEIGPGDEVIMPSFTFTSTANAVVLRGATPVFVDIREDTLNLDESRIEAAIGPRTKGISVVHYAGVSAEMDTIMACARRHDLVVMEDAAQGLLASYKGRPLGSIGDLGAISFHESKNILSGEGGALLINDPRLVDRAQIVCAKGTDRARFDRGEVRQYTWQDMGSSFRAGELVAACLLAQLEASEQITARRLAIWNRYFESLQPLQRQGAMRLPTIPDGVRHNAHIFYVLMPTPEARNATISKLAEHGVSTVFHYIPLHQSPAGKKYGRCAGALPVTENIWSRLIRLPLHPELTQEQQSKVIDLIFKICA
jgi:dTDP-4-amino-4,6-dideoxygalactose transaminase